MPRGVKVILKLLSRYNFKKGLPELPNQFCQSSGYFIIAIVEARSSVSIASYAQDKYICFCNSSYGKVWIEKVNTLQKRKWTSIEDLCRIEDEAEFKEVFDFLVKSNILDGQNPCSIKS